MSSRTSSLPPPSFDQIAELWLSDTKVSDLTRRSYQSELKRFAKWCTANDISPRRLTASSVGVFARQLSSNRASLLQPLGVSKPLQSSSLNQARRIVGAWLRWAAAHGYVAPELSIPVDWPSVNRSSPASQPVRKAALRRAVGQSQVRHATQVLQARNRVVAQLAFWLGLTPTQIAALKHKDFRIRAATLLVRVPDRGTGVSGSWRVTPPSLQLAWKAYEQARGPAQFAVTDSTGSRPVSAITIARIIGRVTKSTTAGGEATPLNARRLRQAFMEYARECGWSTEQLQEHLRRKKLKPVTQPSVSLSWWRDKLGELEQHVEHALQ